MHRSRLAGFIIDCQGTDPEGPAAFWSAALGLPRAGADGTRYQALDAGARDLHVEVQAVEHPSRVHLDIEADDLDAEVRRLEALGARRVGFVERWWVMEAPSGQRFCVVQARSWDGKAGINAWP
jgi:hypothetical protein